MPAAKLKTDNASEATVNAQLQAVMRQDITFIDHPRFAARNFEKELFGPLYVQAALPASTWYQPTIDPSQRPPISDRTSPTHMEAKEERIAFLRYNYAKRKAAQLKNKIVLSDARRASRKLAAELMRWHSISTYLREYICRKNLPLVIYMLTQVKIPEGTDLGELVSEGNSTLARCVEGFDIGRGFKFSTYACRAIRQGFTREFTKQARKRKIAPVSLSDTGPNLGFDHHAYTRMKHEETTALYLETMRTIIDTPNGAELKPVEKIVLIRRFNLDQAEDSGMSLEDIGKIIGLTKERARQIQNKAMQKIRTKLVEILEKPGSKKDRTTSFSKKTT